MAKKKVAFVCVSCGAESPKWSGRCVSCGEWNSIVETDAEPKKITAENISFTKLSDISTDSRKRIITGINEFDLVCGGGIVPGAVTLIGGEPGIGKSTLALQVASKMKTLYVSGEESPQQIKHRAERLKISGSNITMTSNTIVEEIADIIMKDKPECVFIDSVQTISSISCQGPAGSVAQIRESTLRLSELAKKMDIPLFVIGHINKEGSIAGPKVLEHVVDTVLYFEGDFTHDFRILRAFKNRFGSVNEIGLFRMESSGLIEISDKNSIFLNPYSTESPGTAVCAAIEGSRTILFEVQSLVSFSSFSNPRRMADGFDLNRLILLIAVLEKHAACKLSQFDVFLNVAGGFQINETASDLAVAVSIASSYKEKPIPEKTGFLGEISLSGEIRPVSQALRRIQEFERNGFTKLFASEKESREISKSVFSGQVIPVRSVNRVIDFIF
ncbi:MAG: DNA repair protein RadA [Spirochaetes bacterium]|nr:DNA repair protein RadA [Spirochaetota bacterium]